MICPIHKLELVHREGVSKKNGNPYDFWACPSKEQGQFCQYTAPGELQAPTTQVSGQSGQSATSENTELLRAIKEELIKIRETVSRLAPPVIEPINKDGLPF